MDRRLVIFTVAFALISLAYGALAQAVEKAPRDQSWFWVNKITWGPEADILLAGDSRVNRGIDPAAFEAAFPGARALNFGFSGQGFSEEYLKAATARLKPDGLRILILGITPRSLTAFAGETGDYKVWQKMRPENRMALDHLWAGDLFIRAHSPVILFGRAAVPSAPRYQQWHTDLGWMPADRSSHDTKSAEGEYRDFFAKNKADSEVIEGLVRQVKELTGQGVRVLWFAPPVSEPIREIERAESGLDEAALEAALSQAGALKITMPEQDVETFDGHHLSRAGAEAFSPELAEAVRQAAR